MNTYHKSTVQKGRGLSSPEQVNKRLQEIKTNKKSTYHKYLVQGKIAVLYSPDKQTKRWDIVVLHPLDENLASKIVSFESTCAECESSFFDVNKDDYLCGVCRSQM